MINLEELQAKAAIKTALRNDLKALQMKASRTYSQFLDSRQPWVRTELANQHKAMQVEIAQLKKSLEAKK